MSYTISIKVLLNKHNAKKDGSFPLVFQLIYRREKRLIYSPYHLLRENFDEEKKKVLKKQNRKIPAKEINTYIHKTIHELEKIISSLQKEKKQFTTSDIVFLYKSHKRNNLLQSYFKHQIELLDKEGRTGTSGAYLSTLNILIRFIGDNKIVTFSEIDEKWINDFIYFLRCSGLKPNSSNFYLRILRAVYNKAYKEGIEGTSIISPFRDITMNNIKTRKIAVDKSTIKKIAKIKLKKNSKEELARDLFMFSFYCRGMPFVDMAYLKYENIINSYICYSRHKTKQPLKIKITSPLQFLINKYKSEGEHVLPILNRQDLSDAQKYRLYKNRLREYNRDLKLLSNTLRIQIPLSSYVSRHSWATLARENGIPVSVISAGMGHSSEKITYAYLDSLKPLQIDEANEKVINNCFDL